MRNVQIAVVRAVRAQPSDGAIALHAVTNVDGIETGPFIELCMRLECLGQRDFDSIFELGSACAQFGDPERSIIPELYSAARVVRLEHTLHAYDGGWHLQQTLSVGCVLALNRGLSYESRTSLHALIGM